MLEQVNQQKPATSSGLVRPFRTWMSRATVPQLSTVVSVGGGSAPSMPRMRPGTPASSSRATKGERRSCLRNWKEARPTIRVNR